MIYGCNSKSKSQIENEDVGNIAFVNRVDTTVLTNNFNLIDSTHEKASDCSDWNLTKLEVIQVLRLSTVIDTPSDLHYLYYVMPCEITGDMLIGKNEYSYSINGGSYLSISNSDTTFYLGCISEECKNLFITQGGDPERDLFDEEYQ